MSRATIQTKYGTVCGVVDQKGDIVSYKGVPFAAPPVGERRFAPPQPPEPWEGELVCD
ncbi:MAG: carboxylesterase family protein, partial [Oscillospiraceae bacterium]|nr:carboxylesterase family protein [Oscillospiraceae bacterium]